MCVGRHIVGYHEIELHFIRVKGGVLRTQKLQPQTGYCKIWCITKYI